MSVAEAGSYPSLLDVQAMRAKDGSSLSVASNMRWALQLQGFFTISDLYVYVLLGVFCGGSRMDLDRDAT